MIEIKKEFEELIPALQQAEYELLEQGLKEQGCLDSIKIWNNYIIDGHNRYQICTQNNINFKTEELNFRTEEDVKIWIINNQFGRRNISTYQRAVLALELEEVYKAKAKENQIRKPQSVCQISDKQIDTKKEIATLANTSHDTIMKVKAIESKSKEDTFFKDLKNKIEDNEITINDAYSCVKQIDKITEEDKQKVLDKLNSGEAKKAGIALKQVREEKKNAQYKREVKNLPQIYHTDFSEYIKTIPDNYFDLLLTDPLYSTDVEDIHKFSNWIYSVAPKIKDTGSMYICIGSYQQEILAYLSKDIPNFKLSDMLVWIYNNCTVKQPNNKYIKNYQLILYYRGVNAPQINRPDNCTEQFAAFVINAPDGREANRYHSWQKPIEIADNFILNSTNEGDKIFDPFTCTGTFILSANKLNRIGVGCEININNINIALKRGCELC